MLVGTRRNPGLVLTFAGRDLLPHAVKLNRVRRPGLKPLEGAPTMLDWVRRLPGRRWDPEINKWVATGLGNNPDQLMADAGFTVDLTHGAKAGLVSLAQLVTPLVELAPAVPDFLRVGSGLDNTHVVIWPRLTGYEACLKLVPAAARWISDPGCWVAQTADLAGDTALVVPEPIKRVAVLLHTERISGAPDPATQAKAAQLAKATHIDRVRGAADQLITGIGDVPDWFGFDLFGYQHAGAIAVASGHTLLVDEPGLGKTAAALAAAAIRRSKRVVVICPPVVQTNWARETTRSGIVTAMVSGRRPGTFAPPNFPTATAPDLHSLPSLDPTPRPFDPEDLIVRFRPGRKEPELPAAGVVIVSDSLLAARPALLTRLTDWAPDAVIVDEVHRAKSYESARATAAITIAAAVGDGLRVAVTGTPIFASPVDLAAALAITGHLDTVFGGLSAFMDTYCKRNFFNAWVARDEMMPGLRRILEERVWVRRTKNDVLPDLPKKFRSGVFLDVDLAGFNAAHAEVETAIDEWLGQFLNAHGRLPTGPDENGDNKPVGAGGSEIEQWARGQIGVVSKLRQAAGLAKVDAATNMIREHVEATTDVDARGNPIYTRPLVVWVHHRVVGDAMAAAVPAAVARTEIIRGGTSADERGRIVDDFQAGKVPVLIASIAAAGVGITLTSSCDAIFVETDWVVANVVQAEDRCVLEGQGVMTLSGLVPIEEIKVGEKVLTHAGRWKRVTDTWSRSANVWSGASSSKRVITEVEYAGCGTLKVTDDHEVLVRRARSEQEEWAEARSLKPGDFLATPRCDGPGVLELAFPARHRLWSAAQIEASRTCAECEAPTLARGLCMMHYARWKRRIRKAAGAADTGLPAYTRAPNGRYVSVPPIVTVDRPFLELCGWYVAEGFSSTRGGKGSFISLSGHQDERDILARHGEVLKERFGMTYTIQTKEASKGIELRSYGYEMASWFKEMFRHRAANKTLPPWVFDLTREQMRWLMASYVDGDGHTKPGLGRTGSVVSWMTVSHRLHQQMLVVAAALGIAASSEWRDRGIGLHGQDLEALISMYSTNAVSDDPRVWRKVTQVTHRFAKSSERVWDLTVEDDHSYVVGMVAVHNCVRIGQTRPVSLCTLIAPGTLDERIQAVLETKSELLDVLLPGGDNSPAIIAAGDAQYATTPAAIITEIAVALIVTRAKRHHRPAA